MNVVRTSKGFFMGQLVEDLITGLTGRVTALNIDMDDAWHLVIQQPPNDKGKLERSTVSENRCKALDSEPIIEEPAFEEPQFVLGQSVMIRLSKVPGEVRSIDYHITGCIRYDVKTAQINQFGTMNTFYLAADEIEVNGPLPVVSKIPQRRSPEPPDHPSMRDRLISAGASEDMLRGCPVDC